MTKKKHPRVDVEELCERPWCYYCERDFDDQKVLLNHQKAKHFKCDKCNRRLNTAGGLSVHLQQVHKETLTHVENAIDGREGVEPEVFGMMGIPEELLAAHRTRIVNEFFKLEADRRAQTGNPPPGQANGEPKAKKRKIETPEELKARLAEHRAKRAAEREEKAQAEAEKVLPKNISSIPESVCGFASFLTTNKLLTTLRRSVTRAIAFPTTTCSHSQSCHTFCHRTRVFHPFAT